MWSIPLVFLHAQFWLSFSIHMTNQSFILSVHLQIEYSTLLVLFDDVVTQQTPIVILQ